MKYSLSILVGLLTIIGSSNLVAAQGMPAFSDNNAPIEISAENSLEWRQKDKQYIANGSVVVTQDDMTINADQLIADYADDGKGNNIDITQVTATGNVTLKNTDSVAVADKAIYDVKTGLIILTGKNLKLTTPEQVITANERLEYNVTTGVAKAIGRAKITGSAEQLEANTITATFSQKQNGQSREIEKADANGNVKITTKEEVITGNKGSYNLTAQKARMMGNVIITRGQNRLEGDEALIDLATNISRMNASNKTNGRVKGVFFPQSNKTGS